jgi:hypothetical protein
MNSGTIQRQIDGKMEEGVEGKQREERERKERQHEPSSLRGLPMGECAILCKVLCRL